MILNNASFCQIFVFPSVFFMHFPFFRDSFFLLQRVRSFILLLFFLIHPCPFAVVRLYCSPPPGGVRQSFLVLTPSFSSCSSYLDSPSPSKSSRLSTSVLLLFCFQLFCRIARSPSSRPEVRLSSFPFNKRRASVTSSLPSGRANELTLSLSSRVSFFPPTLVSPFSLVCPFSPCVLPP